MVAGAAPIRADDKDINAVMDRANDAYRQVLNGSNGDLVIYSDELEQKLHRERIMENRMEDALKNGEFEVFFQPKIHSLHNDAVGAEALIRWRMPDYGLVSPGEFIPLFEKNRFVLKTDLFVFEQTCRYQASRMARNKRVYPISCNFSRLHLTNQNFVERLNQIVDQYSLPHSLLEIEVTETVAVEDMELVKKQTERLAAEGYSVSIDDFGSGYSSLGIFSAIDFDIVKIDRGLMLNATVSAAQAIIMTEVVKMLNALDKEMVFEGVESREQVEFLRSIGGYIIQGYYFSKPLCEKEYDDQY
ncbi:MAG: EAL domain-containing protein [Eubacteriales bacterium]|nr:EAL domain-containing protein [Eubacteriales bacterium]